MKLIAFMLAICWVISLSGCGDCTNCEPFKEEPFLKVRFLNQVDSTNQVIIIDSVNQLYVKDIRHFQDTTFEFKFPLDMHHDTAVYQLVYRKTTDLTTYINNRIELRYARQFIRRDDNYVIVECNLEDYSTDFNSFQLFCKTNEIECISNEAIAKIYN